MELFFVKGILIVKPINTSINNIKSVIESSGIKNTLLDISELDINYLDEIENLKIKGVNLQIYGNSTNEIFNYNFNL